MQRLHALPEGELNFRRGGGVLVDGMTTLETVTELGKCHRPWPGRGWLWQAAENDAGRLRISPKDRSIQTQVVRHEGERFHRMLWHWAAAGFLDVFCPFNDPDHSHERLPGP